MSMLVPVVLMSVKTPVVRSIVKTTRPRYTVVEGPAGTSVGNMMRPVWPFEVTVATPSSRVVHRGAARVDGDARARQEVRVRVSDTGSHLDRSDHPAGPVVHVVLCRAETLYRDWARDPQSVRPRWERLLSWSAQLRRAR
jgi:hypothetical protein